MLYISCLICYSADTPDTSVCGPNLQYIRSPAVQSSDRFHAHEDRERYSIGTKTKTDFARKILIRFPESETDLGELVSDSKPPSEMVLLSFR